MTSGIVRYMGNPSLLATRLGKTSLFRSEMHAHCLVCRSDLLVPGYQKAGGSGRVGSGRVGSGELAGIRLLLQPPSDSRDTRILGSSTTSNGAA